MTPVLMLTPYFAPQSHAAVFRAHKLAKYLPRHGYRPIVLTTRENYLYNEDPELLRELPSTVVIRRAPYVEPTLRGVRMRLGGRNRSFKAVKAESVVSQAGVSQVGSASSPERGALRQLVSRGYREAIRTFAEWPDRMWTWALSAGRVARALVEEFGVQLVYTSANPESHLPIAAHLKQSLGLPWVADFRDPCGYGTKLLPPASHWLSRALTHRILQETMDQADHVTGLSEAYGPIFYDTFGLPESRFTFIPTGLDESILPDSEIPPRKTLIHVGEVMPDCGAAVLRALREVAKSNASLDGYELLFVGRAEVNEPRVTRLVGDVREFPLTIRFIDHLPQRELYRHIIASRAALLMPGRGRHFWNNFAKMVDYIALGKPVIASVPPASEARKELTRAGLGTFLEGDLERDCHRLQALLSSEARPVLERERAYQGRYTATAQVAAFAEVFDGLVQS